MAVRTIATDLTLTGEKEFNDQMKAVNSNLKNLKSDMALTTAEFKDNADSTEALAKKQEILQNSVEQQREKVRALDAMHKKMAQTYGEDSAAADKYYRETNNAKAALLKMEEQLNSVNKQLEENERAQEDSNQALADAEEQLEAVSGAQEKYTSAVKRAENAIGDGKVKLQEFVEKIKEGAHNTPVLAEAMDALSLANNGLGKALPVAAKGAAAVGAAAVAAVVGLLKLEEETAEYRENQAKLNTAFEAAGHSVGTAEKAYNSLYAVLGDNDTATESAQLLARLATNSEDVASWTDIAAGVVGTFGDALPINSLIEASNETAKVGQVTGALADALNWVGLSEDEFNEKLAACGDEQERNQLITDTLTDAYGDAAAAFKKNNAEIMAANSAQAELDATLAKLGGAVSSVKNKLMAEFLPSIAEVVSAFVDFMNGADDAEEALQTAVENMVDNLIDKLPEFLDFGIDLIVAIATGIVQNLPYLIGRLPQIVGTILEGFGTLGSALVDVGWNMIKGLWQGILDGTGWLLNKLGGWLGIVKGKVTGKDGFDTHSPSKWSEGVFKNVMLGGVAGLDAAGPQLREAFSDTLAQLKADAEGLDSLSTDFNITGRLSGGVPAGAMMPGGKVINITVNSQQLNESEIDYLITKVNQELGRAV